MYKYVYMQQEKPKMNDYEERKIFGSKGNILRKISIF